MGSGYLYATSSYGVYTRKPRYDYIMVKVIDEHNTEFNQPAQIIAILQIDYHNLWDIDRNKNNIYCMVAYLSPKIVRSSVTPPFPIYEWEIGNIVRNERLPNIDYIETSAIQGPAIILPNYLSKDHMMSSYKANLKDDSFILMPISFFNRNDWEDDRTVSTQQMSNEERGVYGIVNEERVQRKRKRPRGFAQSTKSDDESDDVENVSGSGEDDASNDSSDESCNDDDNC